MTESFQYVMRITERAPGFNQEQIPFVAATYQDAVQHVHDTWRDCRQAISLHTRMFDPYAWHWISADGATTDRNHGSGVPEHEQLNPHTTTRSTKS